MGDRQMLYIGLEPASEHVAATLRVDPGQDVVARRKLMFANGVPVRIATSFFRADLFADTRMSEPEFVRPSLQAAIEDLGYTFGRAEESLIARRPTLFERETLQLEPDEWIVQILRTSYSTEGTPVHALETLRRLPAHLPDRPGRRYRRVLTAESGSNRSRQPRCARLIAPRVLASLRAASRQAG